MVTFQSYFDISPEGKSPKILSNHHFPVVFLWFSYGFIDILTFHQRVSITVPDSHGRPERQRTMGRARPRDQGGEGDLVDCEAQYLVMVKPWVFGVIGFDGKPWENHRKMLV